MVQKSENVNKGVIMKNFNSDMGCIGLVIMLALLAIFPPLALIFIIIYGLISDNIGIDNFIGIIMGLGLIVVIIAPIPLSLISILKLGIPQAFEVQSPWLFILAIIETIIIIIILVKKFSNNTSIPDEPKEQIESPKEQDDVD